MSILSHNQVQWAARRGTLELDLLLMPFAKDCYPMLQDAEKAEFCALLEQKDELLSQWLLMGDAKGLSQERAALIEKIQSYVANNIS